MLLGVGRKGNFRDFAPDKSQEGVSKHRGAGRDAVNASALLSSPRAEAASVVSERDTNRKLLHFYRRKLIGK